MRKKRVAGNCLKCGVYRWTLHKDHIVPKWKGGTDDDSNIQRICANCHEDKSREDIKGHQFTKGMCYVKKSPPYICTSEHKAAIRAAHLGKPFTQERCDNISKARRAGIAARKQFVCPILVD